MIFNPRFIALNISPPDNVLSNFAKLNCSTFLTKSTVGFYRFCNNRELPSSESLSPNNNNPISWLELLNIFCWSVNLQH